MGTWCLALETRVTDFTRRNKKPFVLGVAGGSGSGKTYFARHLKEALGTDHCEIIFQDSFYIDQSQKFDHDGGAVNFDHPSSIDFKLLAECIKTLKQGRPTEIPIYDFATHKRKKETIRVLPKPIIIVDGILIFQADEVKKQFDDLVFFDTPEQLRFERRLERDVKERGRTPGGVRAQFFNQVKPMHDEFVEPSKVFAKTIVHDLGEYSKVLEEYSKKLKT